MALQQVAKHTWKNNQVDSRSINYTSVLTFVENRATSTDDSWHVAKTIFSPWISDDAYTCGYTHAQPESERHMTDTLMC